MLTLHFSTPYMALLLLLIILYACIQVDEVSNMRAYLRKHNLWQNYKERHIWWNSFCTAFDLTILTTIICHVVAIAQTDKTILLLSLLYVVIGFVCGIVICYLNEKFRKD